MLAGKFTTPHGIEVPKPGTISTTISLTDRLRLCDSYGAYRPLVQLFPDPWLRAEAGFTVGSDKVDDNNDGKSFLGDLTLTASTCYDVFPRRLHWGRNKTTGAIRNARWSA